MEIDSSEKTQVVREKEKLFSFFTFYRFNYTLHLSL